MKKVMTLMLATAVLIAGLYWQSPYRARAARPTVTLRPVQSSAVQDTVTLYGKVSEMDRRQYYADGAATVLRCYVQEGQRVAKGDPLIKLQRIQQPEEQAAVDAAALQTVLTLLQEGQLEAAEESLQTFSPQPEQSGSEKVYTLYSEGNGTVMKLSAVEGEPVSRLFPCVEVSDLSQLEILAAADETAVGKLRENQSCSIRIPAFSLSGLPGSVRRIQPYARQTGLFTGNSSAETTVSIALAQPTAALKPGYSATVRVTTQVRQDVLLAPYACVGQDEANREYVFVIRDQKLQKRYISTGLELEDSVEICSGAAEGDLLVLDPDQYAEGTEVRYEMG